MQLKLRCYITLKKVESLRQFLMDLLKKYQLNTCWEKNNMKKMVMVLMMVFTMVAGMVAYEPNKELFKVYHNAIERCYTISYYEEVEPQDSFNGKRRIIVLNTDNIKNDAYFHYDCLDSYRKACLVTLGLYTNDRVRYDTKCSDEQIAKVKEYKNRAINEVPFVTEENFETITEKQYVRKFTKYLKNIKKQNKNK